MQALPTRGQASENVMDTRMNLTEIYLTATCKQNTFIAALLHNAKWTRYYNKCNRDTKQKLDQILKNCNHGRCQRMDTAIALVTTFRTAHLLFSHQNTPLGAYIMIVQAVKKWYRGISRRRMASITAYWVKVQPKR